MATVGLQTLTSTFPFSYMNVELSVRVQLGATLVWESSPFLLMQPLSVQGFLGTPIPPVDPVSGLPVLFLGYAAILEVTVHPDVVALHQPGAVDVFVGDIR